MRKRAMRMFRQFEHGYGSRWEAIRRLHRRSALQRRPATGFARQSSIAAASEQARLKELALDVTELR